MAAINALMNAPRRALLSGSQPGCVPCCLPQGSREPPHREVEEVEAGSVLARKLPTRATRFCRDPSKRWSRGHGRPGQRTRQQGRSRVWGQTDHLRGLALAEEGISSTRRSVFYARNLEAEEPGSWWACLVPLYAACWAVVQSGSAQRAGGVESVSLDGDQQALQVDAREFGPDIPSVNEHSHSGVWLCYRHAGMAVGHASALFLAVTRSRARMN